MTKVRRLLAGTGLSFALLFTGVSAGAMALYSQPSIITVYADGEDGSSDTSTSEDIIENKTRFAEVLKEATEEDGMKYELEGNVYRPGGYFWTTSDEGYFVLKDGTIDKMTQKDKDVFFKRMKDAQDELYEHESQKENGLSEQTASEWWKEMQSVDGVGSHYVALLTEDITPDLVAGQSFFKPLNGIISTVLGVLSVAIMSFLAISFMLDIFYITIPMVRMMMDGNGNGGGQRGHGRGGMGYGGGYGGGMGRGGGAGGGPAYISTQAKMAVREEEGGKNALISYAKNSVVKIVVLVLCLMFLISGKIYPIIGWLMNIVASMFGFSSI